MKATEKNPIKMVIRDKNDVGNENTIREPAPNPRTHTERKRGVANGGNTRRIFVNNVLCVRQAMGARQHENQI